MIRPSRTGGILFGGGALVLIAAFFLLFEHREVTLRKPMSGEAARNPFAALRQLYQQKGLPATASPVLAGLPPTDHALFLLSPRRTLAPERAEAILDWVSAGGRLIALPRTGGETSSPDPILSPLGLRVSRRSGGAAADSPAGEELEKEVRKAEDLAEAGDAPRSPVARPKERLEPLGLRAAPEAPERRVSMPAGIRLLGGDDETVTFRAGTDDGALVARAAWGQGEIVLLADATCLFNPRIGEAEHARFAWDLLAGGGGPPAGVAISWVDRTPPLHRLLLSHMRPALVSLLVLLAAWVWSRAASFGPSLGREEAPRRGLLEHVAASGELLWHHGQHRALVEAHRENVRAAVARRLPGWEELPAGKGLERLARASGLPREELRHALYGKIEKDEAGTVRMVRDLERIRRSL